MDADARRQAYKAFGYVLICFDSSEETFITYCLKKVNTKSSADASLDSWKVESLRLTLFPADGTAQSHTGWWERIVGEAPDAVSSKPKEGASREEGSIGEGVSFLVAGLPDRISFIHYAEHPRTPQMTEVPSIGSFAEATGRFGDVANFVISHAPESIRMAVGATLLEPVSDKEAGYHRLQALLPSVSLDATNSRDFFYQINRPVASTCMNDLALNMLSKWTCVTTLSISIQLLDDKQSPVRNLVEPELHAVRVEFDLNTPAEWQEPFSQESLRCLVDELFRHAEDLAAHGDVQMTRT